MILTTKVRYVSIVSKCHIVVMSSTQSSGSTKNVLHIAKLKYRDNVIIKI